jgi:GTP cyclohydrolase I
MTMSRAAALFQEWLSELGFKGDPEMAETAVRFSEMFAEFVPRDDATIVEGFTLVPATAPPGQAATPVAVRSMPFHSFCAHHLVPFFGFASVAYLPDAQLAGFGSIAKVVQHYARRPQLQERLADQSADVLWSVLKPRGLVVRLSARQMCMEMRGARVHGEVEVLAVRGQVDAHLLDMARVERG